MIWHSILLMTLIDILICGTVLIACFGYYRNRKLIKQIDFQYFIQMILFGLIVIGIFYFADLYTMYVLPLDTTKNQSMSVMAQLHLNWGWIASALGVLSVSIGIMYFLNHLLPKTLATLEYRISNMEVVDEITRIIGSELNRETLFQAIVRKIRDAVPYERCVISQLDRESNLLYDLVEESDFEVELFHENDNFIEWLSREIYGYKRIINFDDIRKSKLSWVSIRREEGIKSILVVPILQDDLCVGHISLLSTKAGAFSSEMENLLSNISPHLGIAIKNAKLFMTAGERVARLSMLNEMNMKISEKLSLDEILHNIAKSVGYLSGADHVRIFPCSFH